MTRKVTFMLDEETIRRLHSASERLRKSESEIVREAIGEYHERVGRMGETEKQRFLTVIRELAPTVPHRSVEDVDNEIAEIRAARRAGGRGGARRGGR
jgi:metal-responsive CopG/Arc/MetJ family transcriptional regulator